MTAAAVTEAVSLKESIEIYRRSKNGEEKNRLFEEIVTTVDLKGQAEKHARSQSIRGGKVSADEYYGSGLDAVWKVLTGRAGRLDLSRDENDVRSYLIGAAYGRWRNLDQTDKVQRRQGKKAIFLDADREGPELKLAVYDRQPGGSLSTEDIILRIKDVARHATPYIQGGIKRILTALESGDRIRYDDCGGIHTQQYGNAKECVARAREYLRRKLPDIAAAFLEATQEDSASRRITYGNREALGR